MFCANEFTKEVYKTGDVAKLLGVTPRTIQMWDSQGKINFMRSETGRRVIRRKDLLDYLNSVGLLATNMTEKRDIIYARVSSQDQKKHGDLDRQALFLVENIKDLQNPLILKEVGSGLNDKRVKLQTLIQMVMNDEVNNVYVTYKDRLTRFGFNYLDTVFSSKGVKIVVVKDENSTKSVHDELVEDMMSLIASFSGKLYGLRSNKNKVKEVSKNE
jgi:excisionase family DNA binding protein